MAGVLLVGIVGRPVDATPVRASPPSPAWVASLLGLDMQASPDTLRTAARLAARGTHLQASMLGVRLSTPELPSYALPSLAAAALVERYDVVPDAAQVAALARLDALPEPIRAALTRVMSAFVVFDRAAVESSRAAYSKESAILGGSPLGGNGAVRGDIGALLAARVKLTDTVADLRTVLADEPLGVSWAMTADLCPALAIDLAGTADTYTVHCALIIDVGGDDNYLNNAGGSTMLGGCDLLGTGAGALADLRGNDRYNNGRSCGVNGGGLFGGAGFLLDADGDDVYWGGGSGVNGGSHWGGHGFLLDAGGHDTYIAGRWGTNGGALIGSGFLLDVGGDDSYSASYGSTNGGAGQSGLGLLVDTRGDDSYDATYDATNGGSHLGGRGALLDGGGTDSYVATTNGTNGGGSSGKALLHDAGGQGDFYSDSENGTSVDRTIAPKGTVGAQVDGNHPGSPPGAPQCDDDLDNDGDGRVDYPGDPGCTSASDTTESPDPPVSGGSQCGDGVDNDNDGFTDHPSDPGCANAGDATEGPTCGPVAGAVLACLEPGAVFGRYEVGSAVLAPGPPHQADGHVDIYRFLLPGGISTALQCVVVRADATPINPCLAAGGTYVSRFATLFERTEVEPRPALGSPLVGVTICRAELTVTAFGGGIQSLPAYAVC